MNLRMPLGLSGRSGVDLGAAVQAALAGTAGFALDSADIAALFQTTAGSPVTASGQQVNRWDSRWGTTAYSFWQTGNLGPIWSGTAQTYNGTTAHLERGGYNFLSSVNAVTITARCALTAMGAVRTIIAASTSSSTLVRLVLQVETTGAISVQVRRANADTPVTVTSASGVIAANTAFTVQVKVNYASGGAVEILVNGASVASGTLNGTPAASDASATARFRIGSNLSGTPGAVLNGNFGRFVLAQSILNDASLVACQQWAEAVSI